MYGWRARVGVILPSLNCTMEPELYRMAPEGMSFHATRLLLARGTPDNLKSMADETAGAAQLLATTCVDAILYGCTSGSLIKGLGWDREIIRMIDDAVSIPSTTTSTAVIDAFKALGITKVAVATPYIDAVNDMEKVFFEGHGVEVVNIQGLGFTQGEELHTVPKGKAYKWGKEVDRPEAECLFISCTDFQAIDEVAMLERDLGKPVMSSNTASMWAVLRLLGIKEDIRGYGQIFSTL